MSRDMQVEPMEPNDEEIAEWRASQYVPDEFTQQCWAVQHAVSNLKPADAIAVLEEVIQSLRTEEAQEPTP